MIPKIIHYCWFGKTEKPMLVKKCIRSWKKHCADYQIIEWNEENYRIDSAPLYVRQALEQKMWAFATDYIRFHLIYQHGGIYLDTDVEVLRNFDAFLKDRAFFGFESDNLYVASGLGFGAEQGTPILLDFMEKYKNAPFVLPNGEYDLTANTYREKEVFHALGLISDGTEQILKGGIHIFPGDFFSPCDWRTGIVKKTENTVSIHWYAMSWLSEKRQQDRRKKLRSVRKDYILHFPNRLGKRILGESRYEKLKKMLGRG